MSRFVYGERPNVPEYIVKGASTYRIVHDQVGSPRFVVDVQTGVVVQELTYDAFGDVLADTDPGFQPFGFAGGLWDADTGLVRFGARDYGPVTGRWTAKDPIGFEGGDSLLYGYAFSDPVNVIDPSGMVIMSPGRFLLAQMAKSAIRALGSFTHRFGQGAAGAAVGYACGGGLAGAMVGGGIANAIGVWWGVAAGCLSALAGIVG